MIACIFLLVYISDVKTFNRLKCPDCGSSFGKAKFLTKIHKETMHVNFGEHGSTFVTSYRCYCLICKDVKLVSTDDLSYFTENNKDKKEDTTT